MVRPLHGEPLPASSPPGVEILPLDATTAVLGPKTTARGRCEAERLRVLLADRHRRTRVFVARLDGKEAGRVELFVGTKCSGIHGISVHESVQGRGIGSALLEHACCEAGNAGSSAVVLLATTEGQRLYERHGFGEVARFGYWYRSFRQ